MLRDQEPIEILHESLLRRIEPLTYEEEVVLFEDLDKDPENVDIMREIVLRSLPLIYNLIKYRAATLAKRHVEPYDLIQVVYLHACEKVRVFRPTHVRFCQFVYYNSKSMLPQFVRNNINALSFSATNKQRSIIKNVTKIEHYVSCKLSDEPTLADIAEFLEIGIDEYGEIKNAMSYDKNVSTDLPEDEDDQSFEKRQEGCILASEEMDPEENLLKKEMYGILTETERNVLELSFIKGYSVAMIVQELIISKRQVNKAKKTGIEKLKAFSRK